MSVHRRHNHSQTALLCNGHLVRIVVGKVGKCQTSEVLHTGLIWPTVHRVKDHVNGSSMQDLAAVLLFHGQIAQCSKAVSLNARMLGMCSESCQASIDPSVLGDLLAALVVQGEVRYGSAALFTHFRMRCVMPHSGDNQLKTALVADGISASVMLSQVGKGAAAFSLHCGVRWEVRQRLAGGLHRTTLEDGVSQLFAPSQHGYDLAASLLHFLVLRMRLHHSSDQRDEVRGHGHPLLRRLRREEGHQRLEPIVDANPSLILVAAGQILQCVEDGLRQACRQRLILHVLIQACNCHQLQALLDGCRHRAHAAHRAMQNHGRRDFLAFLADLGLSYRLLALVELGEQRQSCTGLLVH
mmetsp:Transcript_7424/g.16348  ORF Transcript_7424/g.16348 Transcript_7424/m.16348 type:complete len:355 (+) Transcript_7424:933-1997(+)